LVYYPLAVVLPGDICIVQARAEMRTFAIGTEVGALMMTKVGNILFFLAVAPTPLGTQGHVPPPLLKVAGHGVHHFADANCKNCNVIFRKL
jgi:hypothetical protein